MPRLATRDLVLAGSVAVNLVLVGFVVGAGARLAGPDGPPPEPVRVDTQLSPRAVMEGLSDEQRRAVREAFVGEGLRSAPLFRELRDARVDFDAAVRADPFEADAARAALGRIRDAENQLRERSNEVMITILADLPVEERERIMSGMRDRGRRFLSRDGGRRDDDRDDGPGDRGPEDAAPDRP